jgi:O-antigen ligase
MHYSFAGTQSMSKALISIFTLGFAKVRYFILPYILATIAFLVWWQLWRIVGGITIISDVRFILFTAIILAPFFAWLRLYVAKGLKEKA